VVMTPILQLFARDAPGVEFPVGTDVVQILWCPAWHTGRPGPRPAAFWRASAEVTRPLDTAPRLNHVYKDRWVPQPCVVHPEELIEHPPVCTLDGDPGAHLLGVLPAELETRIRQWDSGFGHELSYAALAHAPGWKVGGWEYSWPGTDPLTSCRCGAPMRPLLETYSNEEPPAPARYAANPPQNLKHTTAPNKALLVVSAHPRPTGLGCAVSG
jgi:hypothetical protein